MIRAGDSIVNPVTGERLVFELTSHDTGGAYTLFDTFVEPGGAVASAHVHPSRPRSSRSSRGAWASSAAARSSSWAPARSR